MIDILAAGGDLRQIYAAEKLAKDGTAVSLLGFSHDALPVGTDLKPIDTVKGQYDLVLLPVTPTNDGKRLYAPYATREIGLSEVLAAAKKGGVIAYGSSAFALTVGDGVREFAYMNDEILLSDNAALTAEGALALAVHETPFSLYGAVCLVRGFGRIGTALTARLSVCGARTYVLTRGDGKHDLIRESGGEPVGAEDMPQILPTVNFLFNTAPSPFFTPEHIRLFSPGAVYIELASPPYGINISEAEKLGLRIIPGGGLPGRFSPKSAGEAVAAAIERQGGRAGSPRRHIAHRAGSARRHIARR